MSVFGKFKNKEDKSKCNKVEAIQRKERSISILISNNIPYFEGLPCIETEDIVKRRTKYDIAKRAVACLISIQMAFEHQHGFNKEFILNLIEKFEVEEYLTDKEKAMIYEVSVSNQDIINMTWKYEAYWVLLWSLGIVGELSIPSNICDCEFAINAVAKHDNFEQFLDTCTLRKLSEILDETDLIYRYNWACVDARIKGKPAPSNLNPSVVLERHRALNWLIGYMNSDDFDNMPTDT